MTFSDAVSGLLAGDFSRLSPLFVFGEDGLPSPISRWLRDGSFDAHPAARAEAFTCACFNGHASVVEEFLARGEDPNGGIATGLNAFHWAANRGQVAIVERLIRAGADLETRNSYGGTVLGCTVWSAVHEPRAGQIPVIQMLLEAGAKVAEADFPSGRDDVDALLKQFGR